MLDFSEIPEVIRDIIANYPIHVIDARRFEDSEQLETEARFFFGMLQRDEDADSWQEYVNENREGFQNLSTDTYDAIATFTKMGHLPHRISKHEKKCIYNMELNNNIESMTKTTRLFSPVVFYCSISSEVYLEHTQ